MLIRVSGTTIIELRDVTPIEKESEIMKSDPSFIATNYNFTESLDLYEYVDKKVHLVSGWETIKATRVAKQDAVEQARLKAARELAVPQAVQSVIDEEARNLGFDSIDSVAKYVGFANTYEVDATSLRNWVPLVWDYVYKVQADIEAGTRTEPTLEELLLELPNRM
jgi:hypothetical protein